MNRILWLIIIAMCLVILNEVSYLKETSLAVVIIAMAASIGFLAYINVKK